MSSRAARLSRVAHALKHLHSRIERVRKKQNAIARKYPDHYFRPGSYPGKRWWRLNRKTQVLFSRWERVAMELRELLQRMGDV